MGDREIREATNRMLAAKSSAADEPVFSLVGAVEKLIEAVADLERRVQAQGR